MKRSDYSRVSGGGAFLADRNAGSQVACINVIAHLLRNLEFFIKRSRTWCAMTALIIQSLVQYIPPLSHRRGRK